jgi:transcriptional regulator with XRE-family HTH domain
VARHLSVLFSQRAQRYHQQLATFPASIITGNWYFLYHRFIATIILAMFQILYSPIFVTMTDSETPKAVHQGRNVKRFREMWGIKQEALADQLGEGWSQRRLSSLESKEVIEPELLEELSKALKVSPEVIKNFREETAAQYFNNFYEGSSNNGSVINHVGSYFNTPEGHEKTNKLIENLTLLIQKLLDK